MANPKVAIRLGVDGQAEVKRGFADMRRDGEQAFGGVASAAERAADRQARAWANQANAAKLAAAASRNQEAFNSLLGVGGAGAGSARASAGVFEAILRQQDLAAQASAAKLELLAERRQDAINRLLGVGGGMGGGSAAASAAVFEEAARAEAQLEQRARALKGAIDPAWAAQDRFNAEMREAKTLLDAGKISTEQYMAATMRAKQSLDASSVSLQRHGNMTGEQRARYVQLGYQVQDISMQLATGVNPLIVLAQQGGQTASALAGAGGVAGRVASFFAGPWGAALLAGAAGVGLLWQNLNGAKSSTDALADSQNALASFFDRTTGKIREQNQALIQGRLITARDAEEKLRADADATRARILRVATGDVDLQRAEDRLRAGGTASSYAATLAAVAEDKPWLQGTIDGLLRTAQALAQSEDGAKRLAAEQRMLKGTATEADKAMLGFSDTSDRAGEIMRAVAAKTNDAAGASARHAIEIDRLKKKFAEDKDEKAFADGVARANAALATNKDGLKASTAALRDERRELKDYLRDLESLVQRYDQVGSATKRYRDDMATLARGVADGSIDPEQAATIRRAAIDAMIRDAETKPGATIEVEAIAIGNGEDLQTGRDAQMRYLERLADRMKNLTDNGRRWLDTLLDPAGWREWGDAAMSVLADVKDELLRMAITNPLKEALFGSGGLLAGLASDIGGSLLSTGRFVASAETLAGPGFNGPINIGNNAFGTDNWRGGLTWVAEHGPELINLPKGSQVVPPRQTRAMMAANDRGGGDVHIHQSISMPLSGNAVTPDDLARAMTVTRQAAIDGVMQAKSRRGVWR